MHAQFRTPTTVEEVLASRLVADPLTLLQCCARADGAAAVVVGSAARHLLDRGPTQAFVRRYVSGSVFVGLGVVAPRSQA